MGDPVLIMCLQKLRAEFNTIAPKRDKASDGWIGDTAHQQETSDHNPDETGNVPIRDKDKVNEVHAVDVDADFRRPGLVMETVVHFLIGRCVSGKEKRLRYIIWNKRIWDYRNGWNAKPYKGPSPHTEHAHFSASYDTALEASTAPWGLEELINMSVTQPTAKEIVDELLARKVPFPYGPAGDTRAVGVQLGFIQSRDTTAAAVKVALEPVFDWLATHIIGATKDVGDRVINEVMGGLLAQGRTNESIAADLRAALGDRATAVGLLLSLNVDPSRMPDNS